MTAVGQHETWGEDNDGLLLTWRRVEDNNLRTQSHVHLRLVCRELDESEATKDKDRLICVATDYKRLNNAANQQEDEIVADK